MSITRSTFTPVAFALVLAVSLAIFWDSGNAIAGWLLMVVAVILPAVVGAFERDRIPEGRWWIAPMLTVASLIAILMGFASYAVSRI